jgi:non-ribosomal peptide synthase protein (TIGR01720 family)
VDYPGGANTLASAETVRVSLTAEETQALLQDVPQAHHNQINDVLLTALVQAFTAWTGESFLLVDLEGHGREEVFEDLDLSRTVGWFTTIFPVLLDLGAASNPGEALNMVKDQLRCIPNRGIGYGLLRYIKQDTAITEKLRLLPQSEVRFNYLGQFDQLVPEPAIFGLPRDVSEPSRSQRGSRSYLLDVNGGVAGAQLHMAWTYSENLHRRSTIEALAQDFVAALRLLITQCKGRGAVAYTPSEFPKTKFSLKEFEARIASVDASSRE